MSASKVSRAPSETADCVTDQKWSRFFPKCVAEKDKSTAFIIRAMYVAFSVILRRRELLEPSCFKTQPIHGSFKVKALSHDNPHAAMVGQAIRNAGEAIKAGFLKEISIVISKEDMGEEAIEVHSFRVHYDENGRANGVLSQGEDRKMLEKVALLKYDGTKSVRDQLISLVKSINFITQKELRALPDEWSWNFRITYNKDTPASYRVPGFADTDVYFKPHAEMQSATIGHLRPGHHAAILDVNSVCIEDSYGTEHALKKFNDEVATDLETGKHLHHESFYASFAVNDEELETSPPPKSSALPSQVAPEKAPTPQLVISPENLAITVEQMAIHPESPEAAPKKRGRPRKNANKSPPTSPRHHHPYARVSSVLVETPPNASSRARK